MIVAIGVLFLMNAIIAVPLYVGKGNVVQGKNIFNLKGQRAAGKQH